MGISGGRDVLVRALYWPVIVNAAAVLAGAPLATFSQVVPKAVMTAWLWSTVGLSGAIFLLVTFDGRNQRAVQVFNARAKEPRYRKGLIESLFSRAVPDARADILWKLLMVEFVWLLIILSSPSADIVFPAAFGIVSVALNSIKYDPDIQARCRSLSQSGRHRP